MLTAERQIDEYLFQFDADGSLTILDKDGEPTYFGAHELYCILAFVRLANITPLVARKEHERQRKGWEKET